MAAATDILERVYQAFFNVNPVFEAAQKLDDLPHDL